MIKFFKENKIKTITLILIIFLIVPLGLACLISKPAFFNTNNDWLSFWGSYIGSIVGACVAMYVLVKTLDDNKKSQTRKEIVDFCNLITEKSSKFAQKYEETMYMAVRYLGVRKHETSLSEKVHEMYVQFIETHHHAKALLYELENHLTIRKDIEIFRTANFKQTIDIANKTYKEFGAFEAQVSTAPNWAAIDETILVNKTEEFLETLNKYEKELLGNIVGTGRRQMKTLHEIYNESKTINKSETRESVAEYYVSTLREEIGENKARLLVYKEECYKKVDLNLPMFWMSSIAALIAIFSIIVTMFTSQVGSSDMRGIPYAVVSVAIIVVFLGIYYKLVIADRKNYLLLSLALEQIEHEISQPKLDTKENVVSLSD